jgi:hypothetical protein
MQVEKAEIDLAEFILSWVQEHDLTFAEITKLLAGQILRCNKYAIRTERHPNDPDKKGDAA